MKKRRMDATADRISELPELILHHIMSFLLAKDAALLATMSKALNSAWSSLSYLNFGHHFFDKRMTAGYFHPKKIPELMNVVDQTLAKRQKQKISIQKFWLKLPSSGWRSYTYNWIKTLAALNIKELILIVPKLYYGFHTLPEEFFAAKELNVLELRGFNLELLPQGIKFSSLQKLSLSNTFVNEYFIRAICESCPGLENIILNEIHGLTSLQIAGTLPKLGQVLLCCPDEIQMVDIVVPNLEDLQIANQNWKLLEVNGMTGCKALKKLYLSRVGVTDKGLEDVISSLPKLEYLWLHSCDALKTIKIASDRLQYLKVRWCSNLIVAELDTPNVTEFSYSYSKRYGGDQLPTLKLKASDWLTVSLRLLGHTPDRQWYSKLMKFLNHFNQSAAITLVCGSGKAVVIPKDMRKDLVPPLYGTACLHITINGSAEDYSVVDVLDSLLWISPQLHTLSRTQTPGRIKSTLQFIYADASDEYQKSCCASLPLQCWRHKLKRVKMENFTCVEQQELRNYLLTNAGTVEIDVSK